MTRTVSLEPTTTVSFQPGDRFWAFQTIESSILAGLALLILGFAVYWVTRRLT